MSKRGRYVKDLVHNADRLVIDDALRVSGWALSANPGPFDSMWAWSVVIMIEQALTPDENVQD